MNPRAYDLGARTDSVVDTRTRVVAAARQLFTENGFHRTSLEEVARRADVARATVYHQFGSKVGVLDAVLTDFEQRAGLAALVDLLAREPTDRLLRTVVTAGCDYWATDPELCRKIIGLATTDPAVAGVLATHDAGRSDILTSVVDRLAADDLLTCHPDRAVDVLWLLTSFDSFDLLHRGRRLDAAAAGDLLAELAATRLSPGSH